MDKNVIILPLTDDEHRVIAHLNSLLDKVNFKIVIRCEYDFSANDLEYIFALQETNSLWYISTEPYGPYWSSINEMLFGEFTESKCSTLFSEIEDFYFEYDSEKFSRFVKTLKPFAECTSIEEMILLIDLAGK